MKFKIEIECNNAAFDGDRFLEVALLLQETSCSTPMATGSESGTSKMNNWQLVAAKAEELKDALRVLLHADMPVATHAKSPLENEWVEHFTNIMKAQAWAKTKEIENV